ncbi:MAG: hypothetical protein ACRED0_12215 [Gammaproteobacteria bacterium]
MSKNDAILITGQILEEEIELTVDDLSRACSVQVQRIVELVEEGLHGSRDPAGVSLSVFHGPDLGLVKRSVGAVLVTRI